MGYTINYCPCVVLTSFTPANFQIEKKRTVHPTTAYRVPQPSALIASEAPVSLISRVPARPLLKKAGSFFFTEATVVPKPTKADIPATDARKIPAERKKHLSSQKLLNLYSFEEQR